MTSPDFARNRDNFCYRHPDRQSFVLCQRCLRTICGECQTPAAVGVICPECLADQRRAQSPAQRRAQRRWRSGPAVAATGGAPVMTYVLVGITAAVYLLQLLVPGRIVEGALGLFPPLLYPEWSGQSQPWRLLTDAFVHTSFWHIALNLLSLWLIGRILEPLIGRWRMLTLYLVSAFGGSVAVALLAPGTFVMGASGAIFGLFGALLVIGRHLGAEITGILVILAVNLVIGFIPSLGISWQAHVGGLAAGLLMALILVGSRGRDRRARTIGLTVALCVGLALLLLLPPVLYG